MSLALGLVGACLLVSRACAVRVPETAPIALGAARAAVGRVDGVPVIAGNDLAHVLEASQSWRSDVRKLVLTLGTHRLTFTVDNPFVLADGRTLRLSTSVLMRSGEVQVPLDLLTQLPQGEGWPRLLHDTATQTVWAVPASGLVGPPVVETRDDRTMLTFACGRPDEARVVANGRARFRVRLPGVFAGTLPDSLPEGGLVNDVEVSAVPDGVVFTFALSPKARGWRLEPQPDGAHVALVIAERGDGLQAFARERADDPRPLRTVVLDPGHGGAEAGVRAENALEKDLALELSQRLALALQRRGVTRVLLTRSDDHDLSAGERADLANRANADAVIALHFESWPTARAAGAVIWCAPGTADDVAGANRMLAVRPWREAGRDRAIEARELADAVAGALDRHGYGPTRVRERLPLPLVGVQAPGLMIACGNLSAAEDRARWLAPGGLDALADALAEGVLAWSRD